jgi:hypothetical protein
MHRSGFEAELGSDNIVPDLASLSQREFGGAAPPAAPPHG